MSNQANRLGTGGRIDRSKPLRFTFDGKSYYGYQGDTLASALLANGVVLVGRSFKYHRPRGILSAGAEEPNALIQLGTGNRTEPNLRATQIELYDGLVAESQNRWPSLANDMGAVNSLFHRLFPSGFYYKTFMWPKSFWMKYELIIRRMAGLGKSPTEPDPDRYDKLYAHCDALVVGSGPAGLAAALAAGRAGARVILVDEQQEFGGSLLHDRQAVIDGKPAADWVASAVAELAAMPEVTLLPRTVAFAYYDHNAVSCMERVTDHLAPNSPDFAKQPRQRLWRIRAKDIILATGAIERPLVYLDNDRPGCMLASAAQTFVNRYGAMPGKRAVVMTNNDSAYRAALDLADAGVAVPAIVDLREDPQGELVAAAKQRGIDVLAGHAVTRVSGKLAVSGVEVMRLSPDAKAVNGPARSISCDLVMSSSGWQPTVHLFSQSRGKLRWEPGILAFVPDKQLPGQNSHSVGAAAGIFNTDACLADGHAAGAMAANAAGCTGSSGDAPTASSEPAAGDLRAVWYVPSSAPVGRQGKHFIDYQNDVTAADVMLAHREGYRSVEHLKRYTTMGMATDQGKTSNVNALALMAELRGVSVPEVGTTTFRPPYTPVTIGAFSGIDKGDFLDPIRKTPLHSWHEQHGAPFETVGQWHRAWYYPKPGESMHDAVNREVKAVRTSVGIVDASTLGKIDIQGPDAAWFLNMVYTNAWSKLEPGKCRYGLMLGEDGMVMDDGVTSRISENHFHMTTTTGGAARVMAWLEDWLQCEWLDKKVYLTSVTEQWAVIGVSGPLASKLMAEVAPELPLDDATFPHLSFRDGVVAGVNSRIYRITFTGEATYEINVAPSYAMHVWRALMQAGEKYGITPYGTEAMHVLRAEKGFIIVGQETDGTTTPQDLGMDWIVSKQKPDFLGKRSLQRSDTGRPDRKHLVGLLTDNPNEVLPEGAQIVAELKDKPPMEMIGHVTSSYWSPNCGRSIAMALVKNGRNRHGETVYMPYDGKVVRAKIGAPKFLD
ncbi:MAG: sarcosine oxidase subunit alpha [Rhodospirillaceae bacterium]|nr:sarcosine oxidase subunit alpha [Rhodospirillaceae bacterium]